MAGTNTDPTKLYHFITSINNMSIADKIAKKVRDAPRKLQNVFMKALTLEAGLHLAKGVHLWRFSQVI